MAFFQTLLCSYNFFLSFPFSVSFFPTAYNSSNSVYYSGIAIYQILHCCTFNNVVEIYQVIGDLDLL